MSVRLRRAGGAARSHWRAAGVPLCGCSTDYSKIALQFISPHGSFFCFHASSLVSVVALSDNGYGIGSLLTNQDRHS